MSIKVYTGRMGSGKSYEVVSSVILPALGRGRRVVSNIAGLNYEAISLYLKGNGVESVGELVSVSHEDVANPWFWLTDGSDESDKQSSVNVPFLQAGDLLVLDEVWRFWDGFNSRRMSTRIMNFFRMHRHFVNAETGVTCDVILITQDVGDIGKVVRAVIEETYLMTKLTVVGSSKGYRVEIYSGAKIYLSYPVRTLVRTYNPDYFKFYQSHSQKSDNSMDAVEENVDKRGNILRGSLFRVFLPLAVIFFGISIYFLWGFFHPKSEKQSNAVSASSPAPVVASPAAAPVSVPVRADDEVSRLLSESTPYLHYYRVQKSGEKEYRDVGIKFEVGGKRRIFTKEMLGFLGWKVFMSIDGDFVILTNGRIYQIVGHDISVVNRDYSVAK
jgi:zona occludens toxin